MNHIGVALHLRMEQLSIYVVVSERMCLADRGDILAMPETIIFRHMLCEVYPLF